MSESERARLNRNVTLFKALKRQPDQFRQIRELHRAVEADDELQKLMNAYHSWLTSLSPWQRDELRKQTDSKSRLQLVRQFKQQQEVKQSGREILLSGAFGKNLGRFQKNAPKFKLSPQDFAAVMNVIERRLPLAPEQRKKLQSLSDLERHLRVLEGVSRFKPQQRPGLSVWANKKLTNEMIDAISDRRIRQALRSRRIPEPDRVLLSLVGRALVNEWQAEFQRRKPSKRELKEFFLSLKPQDRDQIMALGHADDENRALMLKYYRDKYGTNFSDLRRIIQRIFPRARNRPSGSGGRFRSNDGGRLKVPFERKADPRDFPKRRRDPATQNRN